MNPARRRKLITLGIIKSPTVEEVQVAANVPDNLPEVEVKVEEVVEQPVVEEVKPKSKKTKKVSEAE